MSESAGLPADQSPAIDVAQINRQMAKGAGWMVAIQMAVRCIGLVSTVILARLLVPEDFGLVALATMLFGALEIMATFSFDLALIRDQQADRSHYDTVWTLGLARAAVMALLLVAFADAAAAFFDEPRLSGVLYWLALAAFIQGFSNVGVVQFRKELEFQREFRYRVCIKLSAFIVTVTMAVIWRDYWALIAGIVGSRVAEVLLSYYLHHFRPRLGLSRCWEVLHFAKWLAVNNILIFIANRADTFIIGKFFGVDRVGLYSVAYEVSNLPTTELVWPIQRAIFPGYAKLNGDLAHLRRAYLDVLAMALLLAAPLGIGIGLVAEQIVAVFLGPKWLAAVPLLEILAIYGVIRVGFANTGAVFLALGRASTLTYLAIAGIAVRLPLLVWWTMEAGVTGAAWALAASAVASLLLNFTAVLKVLQFGWSAVFSKVWRPIAAAAVMAASVNAAEHYWMTSSLAELRIAELAILAITGAVTYGLSVLVLWRLSGAPDGAEKQLLGAISGVTRRSRPAERLAE